MTVQKDPLKVEKNFDFLARKTAVTNAVKLKVGIKPRKINDKDEKTMWNSENGRRFIAGMIAVAGLIGVHFNVEYAGWLIFLAFWML